MTITALMPVYPRCGVRPVRGEGVYLYGEDGEQYLDFAAGRGERAGPWPSETGRGDRQPGRDADACVEPVRQPAVSISRSGWSIRPRRHGVLHQFRVPSRRVRDQDRAPLSLRQWQSAAPYAHHVQQRVPCRTLGAISATNQPKMRDGFEPLLPGFAYAPFDDLEAALALIDENTAVFPGRADPGRRWPAPREHGNSCRGCARRATSMACSWCWTRCSAVTAAPAKFFAHELYGVKPDIMASAKGIGGGFPLGRVPGDRGSGKGMVAGTHGSTYGGNPLAMAAGEAVLDVMQETVSLSMSRRWVSACARRWSR